ncbi:MAG: hypothetical protein GX193_06490 [Clostridiales bacterium]|nr:hypothetical protein [Clostridiales bacterium]
MKKNATTGRLIINKNRIITGLAILISAILLAVILLPGYLDGRQVMYPVLTARHDIPRGKNITGEDISLSETSDKSLSGMCYSSPENVIGKTATRDIPEGSFIMQGDAAENFTSNTVYDSIPDGYLLISISVQSLARSVAGHIRANDIIRFYALDENGTAFTPPELQYIKVLAVYNSQGEELGSAYINSKSSASGSGSSNGSDTIRSPSVSQTTGANREHYESPSLISLLVTQEQALRLVELEMSGRHFISLVSRDDEERESEYLDLQQRVLESMLRGKIG